MLARLVDLALRRHRRELEQRRRQLVRLFALDVADDPADDDDVMSATEPPATGGVVLRLERPAGGGRRETR